MVDDPFCGNAAGPAFWSAKPVSGLVTVHPSLAVILARGYCASNCSTMDGEAEGEEDVFCALSVVAGATTSTAKAMQRNKRFVMIKVSTKHLLLVIYFPPGEPVLFCTSCSVLSASFC